jgi:hypothetical protein
MSENPGSLRRHAALAACLIFAGAARAAAQPAPQPTVVPAPSQPEFFARTAFHLTACALSIDDKRFSWDTHFGGALDLVDYVVGRAGIYADYEAVLGDEFRIFDPNQGNYTLEASMSGRVSRDTEIVGIFHHVSRHLSDRPKRLAIAWNLLGVRVLHQVRAGTATVDFDLEGGKVTQHSYVDYTWIAEAHVQVRAPVTRQVTGFARASVQTFRVDGSVPRRESQTGAFVEGGVRLHGPGGTMELFAGLERRVDADPLDRQPHNWALAGFRLLSR